MSPLGLPNVKLVNRGKRPDPCRLLIPNANYMPIVITYQLANGKSVIVRGIHKGTQFLDTASSNLIVSMVLTNKPIMNKHTATEFLSQTAAASVISPDRPLSRDTMQRWHDLVKGPRDSSGRRIWTHEICDQVRKARAK